MPYRILFSNLGYAKGIDGSLDQHLKHWRRHFVSDISAQKDVIGQLRSMLAQESPDLCCFVEVRGGQGNAGFHQLEALMCDDYPFADSADKYGENRWLGRMPLHQGRCNGFLSKAEHAFTKLYFSRGSKRLIYKIQPRDGLTVIFAHLSLLKKTRELQMEELGVISRSIEGEVVVLADFNIEHFRELTPLTNKSSLHLLNREDAPTFRFHKRNVALDLCLCSPGLQGKVDLRILPQRFSDHDALLVSIDD